VAGPGDDDRASMEARNAAMKEQMNGLLDKFNEQTKLLEEAQQAAAATTATVTSEDGAVTVTVDATGAIADLQFDAKAFKQADPTKFAQTVMQTVHTAAMRVKKAMSDMVAPVTQDLPDLSDLVEGAPSLRGLMPEMPDFSEVSEPAPEPPRAEPPKSERAEPEQPGRPQRRRPVGGHPDDDLPDSWLVN
jgi:DNA-binding protein YbaB